MIPARSQNASAVSPLESTQSSLMKKQGPKTEYVPLPELKTAAPIIFSMTKTKRKNAKRMMNGKGPILDDVDRAVQFAAKYVQEDKKRTVMVPVVLFFERKQ